MPTYCMKHVVFLETALRNFVVSSSAVLSSNKDILSLSLSLSLKPQFLLESVVCLGNGKGVFLVNSR